MTVHDLLAYAEYTLREDKEYWKQMDKLSIEIEQLIYKQRQIMAGIIIRLAVAMISEKSCSKCADCVGGSCEDCLEGKDHDEE